VSPTITTSTRTSTDAGHDPVAPVGRAAVLEVERGGRIVGLRRGARVVPRVLARGPVVRAALVPAQAGPLAGDRDVVRLRVGAGARLVLEPIAATVALPGPRTTRLELEVVVEADGRLLLDEPPLIVPAGADVVRTARIELHAGAIAVLRDLVVLGRAGEPPGRLHSTTRVTLAGAPLLHDELRLGPGDPHVALAPGDRVAGTVALLGSRGEPALAGAGALRRASGASAAEVRAALAPEWERWGGSG
jgi:urease accessory protein